MSTPDGLRAVSKDRPISPSSVERYLGSKFGDNLGSAMRKWSSWRSRCRPSKSPRGPIASTKSFGRPFRQASRAAVRRASLTSISSRGCPSADNPPSNQPWAPAPFRPDNSAASLPICVCATSPDMKPPPFSVLTICGLEELDYHSAQRVSHVLSILDPDWPEPDAFRAFDPHLRTTLHFHDAIEPGPGIVLPQKADVEAILAFGRDAGDDLRHLLIHCHAGISRSTAAMAMILAQAFPQDKEDAIVDRLMRIRPQALPNSRMIEFADELLGREGRLNAPVSRRSSPASRPKARIASTSAFCGNTIPGPGSIAS